MELEPVADVGGDERAASTVLLDAQVVLLRARDGGFELVLVEHEAEVVHARRRPLARLDDDVHRTLLELGQPELEAHRVELAPRDPRLVRCELLADAAVARDEVERELADVARLDLADAARDEVIVEELHGGSWCQADMRLRAESERGILRSASSAITLSSVAELSDSEVLDAILISCQYVHVKLDQILEIFGDDGQEEEDEADG